jgi:hypothetical protein
MFHVPVAIAFLLLAVPVAGQRTPPSLEAIRDRMTHFYVSPSQEEFEAIQLGIRADLNKFVAQANGADTLATVFLARVHQEYGWPLLDLGTLTDRATSIVAGDRSSESKYIQDDSAIDPHKLDIWWISFFATGDTRYLGKLVAQLGDVDAQSGSSKILVTGEANSSFRSNCREHPAVLQYAKSLLARDPRLANRKVLEQIVMEAEAQDD